MKYYKEKNCHGAIWVYDITNDTMKLRYKETKWIDCGDVRDTRLYLYLYKGNKYKYDFKELTKKEAFVELL
jgi:hypothetical protein